MYTSLHLSWRHRFLFFLSIIGVSFYTYLSSGLSVLIWSYFLLDKQGFERRFSTRENLDKDIMECLRRCTVGDEALSSRRLSFWEGLQHLPVPHGMMLASIWFHQTIQGKIKKINPPQSVQSHPKNLISR